MLGGSGRVSKASARVSTVGSIDELNSILGLIRSETKSLKLGEALEEIQRDLFSIGAELATPNSLTGPSTKTRTFQRISSDEVQRLEQDIDKTDEKLDPLTSFILPGGTKVASLLHVARGSCRRAERDVVNLDENDTISPAIHAYLNRLSDLLFVLARESNSEARVEEKEWDH